MVSLLRSVVRPITRSRPHSGWVEQDPDQWWSEVQAALLTLGPASAIAVTGQANGVVLVDQEDRPCRPAIIWEDSRHMPEGGVDGASPEGRLRWLEAHEPEVLANARWWLLPKDYINLRLTGTIAADAASSIGLTDGRAYKADLPEGLRSRLAPLMRGIDALGSVHHAVVATGLIDSLAAMYGSGHLAVGAAFDVSGTTETVGLVSSQAAHSSAIRHALPLWPDRYLHAGPTQAGGDAASWAQQAFAPEIRLRQLFDLAQAAGPRETGILFLPYLSGERAPLWNQAARGVFFGLTREHRRDDLFRAVLEGVAFSIRHVLESIEGATPEYATKVICSGGAAVDTVWIQIKADVLGRPVEQAAAAQAGTLGAAMTAACALGAFSSMEEAGEAMVRRGIILEPTGQTSIRTRYDGLYRIYCDLAGSLTDSWKRLGVVLSGTPSIANAQRGVQ